jgi:peptide chain release factor subunit 1
MPPEQELALNRYKFRRALEEIEKAKGRGTELVSVFIPPTKPIFDVTSYLRGEHSQSSNIKSTSTRKHVTGAIESIIQRLKAYRQPPEHGLVVFVGHQDIGADQTEQVAFVLEPPEPVASFLYRCDSKFYTEPLHDMIAEKDLYGLIVVDRGEATVAFLKGKRIEVAKNMQSGIMGKHRMGGQSARRFERNIEIEAREFFKKVAGVAEEAFLPKIREVKGILVGGPGGTKEEFVRDGYLHHELAKKVVPTYYDTGYTDEVQGPRELVEKAKEELRDLDLMREKALVTRLFEEIRKDGALAAYGEDVVRHALGLGAVDVLLVSEGLRKDRRTWKCASCGREFARTLDQDDEGLGKCPECGGSLEATATADLVEELSGRAKEFGSRVELISRDSEEGELFLRAFGGLAAMLRYAVG